MYNKLVHKSFFFLSLSLSSSFINFFLFLWVKLPTASIPPNWETLCLNITQEEKAKKRRRYLNELVKYMRRGEGKKEIEFWKSSIKLKQTAKLPALRKHSSLNFFLFRYFSYDVLSTFSMFFSLSLLHVLSVWLCMIFLLYFPLCQCCCCRANINTC